MFFKSAAPVSAGSVLFFGASVAADSLQPDRGSGARGAMVEADGCVYGSTPGGVMAAVQAARLGKSVVLVTPDKHPGGGGEGIIVPADEALEG
jgi:hypothetical protein